MVWLKYLICLAIILYAGTKLARYGDVIASKTGLGRIWIGLVLLATITTMPELVTGVSSAALVGQPDLAVGTLFGSCMFNLFILAVMDILYRRAPVLSLASSRHMALAGAGILLVAIAGGGILAHRELSGLTLGWVGIPSIVILILYLVVVRQMFQYERKHPLTSVLNIPSQYEKIPVHAVYLKFALAAAVIIGAGIWLAFLGDEIAEVTGWGTSFVGTIFLAVTTSMPELVIAIAALRLGAIDMAVADVLGANMLDMVVIFWADIFYTEGAILSSASSDHFITAMLVVMMNLIIIAGLGSREANKSLVIMSWYTPALIALYIFGAYNMFFSGAIMR